MNTTNYKNLIIHVTSSDSIILKDRLHENTLFQQYYDGWESTLQNAGQQNLPTITLSTRYYYYDIPHAAMRTMIIHLQEVKGDFTIQVKIGAGENHNFD